MHIREQSLGPDHLLLAATLFHLGKIQQAPVFSLGQEQHHCPQGRALLQVPETLGGGLITSALRVKQPCGRPLSRVVSQFNRPAGV